MQVVYKTLEKVCTPEWSETYSRIGDSIWDPPNCDVLRYIFSDVVQGVS